MSLHGPLHTGCHSIVDTACTTCCDGMGEAGSLICCCWLHPQQQLRLLSEVNFLLIAYMCFIMCVAHMSLHISHRPFIAAACLDPSAVRNFGYCCCSMFRTSPAVFTESIMFQTFCILSVVAFLITAGLACLDSLIYSTL